MRALAGAIFPNTSNFRRAQHANIVARMRRMVESGMYARPDWLEAVERAPPPELLNLNVQNRSLKNPYPKLIAGLLLKYPDMRFQDCFVDGNDWSRGNDRYRDDHPVMQFVTRQLQLMNSGMSRSRAFVETENEFRARREQLELKQKIEMAIAANTGVVPAFGSANSPNPLFTTAEAYARQKQAQLEIAHLRHIQLRLRKIRDRVINEERKWKKKPLLKRPDEEEVEGERILLLGRPTTDPEWMNKAVESFVKADSPLAVLADVQEISETNKFSSMPSLEKDSQSKTVSSEEEKFDYGAFLNRLRQNKIKK